MLGDAGLRLPVPPPCSWQLAVHGFEHHGLTTVHGFDVARTLALRELHAIRSVGTWRRSRAIRFACQVALCVLVAVSWQARRAELPHVVQCEAGAAPGVVWDFCDKQGANLSGASLLGGSLKNTNLSGTNLTAAKLSSADLAYANLAAAKLLNADLRDANLTGAILRGADLSGADLTGANLSFADLTDAKLAATTLQQALLAQTIWRDGVVCTGRSVGVCIIQETAGDR